MKIQKSTLPKFEISNFGKIGFREIAKSGHIEKPEIRFRFVVFGIEIQNLSQKLKILVSKNEKSGPQNLQFDYDFQFLGRKFVFKIPKSFSLISLEFQFEAIKFEISSVENPHIFIFASKFSFSLQIFLRPKS